VRPFIRCDAEQPLTKLRVMHALGVLGELLYILGFIEVGVAKHLEDLLMMVRVKRVEKLLPPFVNGAFQPVHVALGHVSIPLPLQWRR
jgi:hypothetical protein